MQIPSWDNLKPYSGDSKKSFEELCYQIVSEQFKDDIAKGAILTSIDDSGGGDGVEFYLTFANGDVFGWQAKFFCRLNEGGRKEQIKTSLQTAYIKHPNLKKWFLCTKCNLTPDEKTWFDASLPSSTKAGRRVLPDNHCVELIHWGESKLFEDLKNHPAIHKFFFSEKLLTMQWFRDRYESDIQKTQIKAKYESKIHIPTDIDTAINKILGGNRLAEILEKEMNEYQVELYEKEYKDAFLKLFSEDVIDEYKHIQSEFRKFLTGKDSIIEAALNRLLEIKNLIPTKDEKALKNKINELETYVKELRSFYDEYRQLTESELCEPIQYLNEKYEEQATVQKKEESKFVKFQGFFKKLLGIKEEEKNIRQGTVYRKESEQIKSENNKRGKAREILFDPLYSLKENAVSSVELCLNVFELLEQNEFHLSGEAGMGKTHIAFNIYEDQIINQNQPAIFIFAKDINNSKNLEAQLKDNLGIPTDWSFDDFLATLEIAAKVNKTKIPIIIDGLNESTNWNLIWRSGLENFIIKIKKYPHIVLITTYRTSYEEQLFPDGYFDYKVNSDPWKIKKSVRGFEGLTWDAIDKYFQFYKIKLDSHSNAIGYFKHPLHLKLFCEAKNPRHNKEVNVSFQNEDLFEVFDEYIKNSNANITSLLKELDSKYDNSFTENKLLQLSKYMWENNCRGIPHSEQLFTSDELRIFEGENLLIFRDWNRQTDKEEIQFTYDLLGGYFVSKYLIKTYEEYYPPIKFSSNGLLGNTIKTGLEFFIPERGTKLLEKTLVTINKWLGKNKPLLKFAQSSEFRHRLLVKKTEHPLFDDILRTICILLIKKNDIFLFDILQTDRAKKYSTESLFEINSIYIKKNQELIKAFLKTEFVNKDKKVYLFNLTKNVEFDVEHPLNFNLWSDFLIELAMADRDLSWGEYVRRNHSWFGRSYFSEFVESFEDACKEERELSDKVHIAAKKVMWVLTTNIRRLRDEAHRALYYYARKYPKEFLQLLKYSLGINDPYVPERMLAISYGLAMAKQSDFTDIAYKEEYLPQYGRFLFECLFAENAKYTTTHILARDYAKRTIDIAILHYPNLLSASEKELIAYPLSKYPHKQWRGSDDKNSKDYRDGNAPMHMDFRNYTIGRLIQDRHNYDDGHSEYKAVLSQIYWRIYDLGYSLDKFGEIDKQIASETWNYSRHENTGKVDRYGKKYSWIAFYEMAGYRSDLGLLKGWDDEDGFRISDVDIDPSFPVELKQYNLFEHMHNNNFLGDENQSPEVWCDNRADLDIQEYIELNSDFGNQEKHDWVLLKGSISQKNKEDQTRDAHIAINAILVNSNDFEVLDKLITQYDDYTFDYMDSIEEHYLYEGEIPWCDLMPDEYHKNLVFSYNYHDVVKTKNILKILNNGKELTIEEQAKLKAKEKEYLDDAYKKISDDTIEIELPFMLNGGRKNELTEKTAMALGYECAYVDVDYTEESSDSMSINAESTVFRNSWESYHSEIMMDVETKVPSKSICNILELSLKPQSSDLYNKNGDLVSTSFKYGKEYGEISVFTYIRKDYLDKYLEIKNKKILWLQWSEKRYFQNGVKKIGYGAEREKNEYRTYYAVKL